MRFSIVVPAFNEAGYIAETIRSLHQQDFDGSYEIIVVDNNSTDSTAEICRNLGVILLSAKQPGVCFARQKGTMAAKGEIIISTDADTYFDKNWLTNINTIFANKPHAVAVVGSCHYNDGPIWGSIYPRLLFGLISLVYKITKRSYYASATNIAFKKSAFGGYNTILTQGGDELDLLRNLRSKGEVVFDNSNPTHTSARRLARGLLYNFFVSFLIYYILEYNLNRIFGRRILGSAPKFRNDYSPKILSVMNLAIFVTLVVALITQRSARNFVVQESGNVIQKTTNVIERGTH